MDGEDFVEVSKRDFKMSFSLPMLIDLKPGQMMKFKYRTIIDYLVACQYVEFAAPALFKKFTMRRLYSSLQIEIRIIE